MRARLLLTAAVMLTVPTEGAARVQAADPVEPFRVIGNIYYVGGQLGSYLITTPDGHILHDTGTAEMHRLIVSNIEKLGFDPRDVRIMISSHAHWDHVEGHAEMQRVTGAQVVALGGDAVALETGEDNSALGARGWEPVTVDRVIRDGDTVTLGGVTLQALWTGGHTQGATMWLTTVREGERAYSVAFRGGETPNAGVELLDNPRHPNVVDDTKRTLQRLGALEPPDLFLHNHALTPPDGLDPALPVSPECITCIDAEGWSRYVARAQTSFEAMLRRAGGAEGVLAPEQPQDAAAAVEAREIAFAKTMADRDFEAFLSFISPEAVFFAGERPLRGREEIGRAWAPFFEGPTAPFSWQPDVVAVLESGDLALSSGPVTAASGEPDGRFNSVWRRDGDGRWRVVFDKGS